MSRGTGRTGRSGPMSPLADVTVQVSEHGPAADNVRLAVCRRSTFLGTSVPGDTELPEQEAENVSIFLDLLVDGSSAGVAGLRVVEQQNRAT